MISLLGWIATGLILLGYYLNSIENRFQAFIVWIVGDVLWIAYDIFIFNWSHMTLSVIIIFLNSYGIYKSYNNDSKRISKDN